MHLCGDFNQVANVLAPGSYHNIVSWLTVLHFDRRTDLFEKCYKLLRPGGTFYAADFFARNRLTVLEKQILRDEVYCHTLPSLETYTKQLESAGFEVAEIDDRTNEWKAITAKRVQEWDARQEEIANLAGESVYADMGTFYQSIADLYEGGNLGGLTIVARKPPGW